MSWPPSILRLRLRRGRKRGTALWVPLILIWPVLAAVWIALWPGLLLLALLSRRRGAVRAIALGAPRLLVLGCHLRGLRVTVQGRDGEVHVAFF
jgi:hypothetical protein